MAPRGTVCSLEFEPQCIDFAAVSQMLKSSGAIAGATLTSRLLGMVREIVYAGFYGNSWVASAFVMAFTVPNLFRRLLGEGALTAAFIPIFKQKEVREGEREMWRAANAVLSGLIAAAGVVSLLAMLGISAALAIGVSNGETQLMLRLLRWMFPYMLLVCMAATLIGMANARGHFFLPALGAVVLNLIMISSVLFLAPRMGRRLEQQVFGLAIGVLVAGVAQTLFQLPILAREGYRFRWVSPWRDPTVREVVRKMVPGSIGVAAFQINVLLIQIFAFWFDPTIVATFQYSVRLMELPQGMFGASLATFLLPTLSGLVAEKKFPEFRQTLSQGLSYLALGNLLAGAIALSLAVPIVRLIFEHGKFGPDATERAALALACLAPGLLLFSMNNILARAFYALDDILTPMKISIFCLGVNLAFACFLVKYLSDAGVRGEAGLATANTLSAGFNVVLLLYALRRKLNRLGLAEVMRTLLVLVPDAILTGVVAKLLETAWERHFGHWALTAKIGAVFVPGAVACLVYWGVALALKVPAAREATEVLVRRFVRPQA